MHESAVFAAEADNVSVARTFVALRLETLGCGSGVVQAAQLLVSELATNALDGESREFAVVVRREGRRVTVEVGGQDAAALAEVEAARHLQLVDSIAHQWQVHDHDDGSCSVEFSLPC